MRLLFIFFTKYSYLYLDDSPKVKNNLPEKINPKWDYIVPKNMCFEHNSTSQRKEKYRNVWIYRKRNFSLESFKNFIRNFNLIQKQPSKGVVHRKRYSEICSKFTEKLPCQSMISIKFLCNFIEITLWHWCTPLNLLHILRATFSKNTSGRLLLMINKFSHQF